MKERGWVRNRRKIAPLHALTLLLALPAPDLPALAPRAAAQEAATSAPDFSAVTTRTAARKLVREGRLVEILFVPVELGGSEDAENVGYITPEAAAARAPQIDTLRRLIEGGLVDRLEVAADYKGDEIIPCRIVMTGSRTGQAGSITLEIEVW